MSKMMSLKDAERRIWTLYFEDGLWDIFFGLLLLGGGLRALTDSLWYYLLVLAGILIYIGGKRFVTLPRMGAVRFGPARKLRNRQLRILVVVAVLITFTLLLLILNGVPLPGSFVGLAFALVVPLVLAAMAYLMDFNRLYIYAIAFGVIALLTELASDPLGALVQSLFGFLALVYGVALFVIFLRKYPVPEAGAVAEKQVNGSA
jgi:hypothetical protein